MVDWASLEHRYYPACCEEWAESGALHCTGRASLQDFIQVGALGPKRTMRPDGGLT